MPENVEKPFSTWKHIQQRSQRGKATTKVAKKRRLVILLRGAFVVLLLAMVASGVLAIRYFHKVSTEAPPPVAAAQVEIVFQSDGVLTVDWLRSVLPDLESTDIRQIDPLAVKELLEADGQVATASVAVSLPSALKITLEEREPVLRVRIRGDDGKPLTLLIARDGTVYKGSLYPVETLLRLPGTTGLRVRREGDGYLPIEGIDPVARLLDIAQKRLPALYRHWKIVDLSDWNPDLDYRPVLIKVSSSHIEQIIFSTDGLEEQIERLAGILEHIQRYQLGQPKLIDLSFGGEAVIRYK